MARVSLRRLRHLAGVAILYGAALWWIHSSVRAPFARDYFEQYVAARCSDAAYERLGRSPSREGLVQLGKALESCQETRVEVDGVWGGIFGAPSVRLRVRTDGGASTEFRYYSVDVDPILGVPSIRYTLDPGYYYWNF
jgi:hypothetical protein